MKTKMILKRLEISIAVLTILVSANGIGHAVVVEDAGGQDAQAIENKEGLIAPEEGRQQEPEYVPGEVLVKFKEGAEPQAVLQWADIEPEGLERVHSIKPDASRIRKDYKLERTDNGWYSFLGKNYKEVEDIPDEELFKEAYEKMPEVERSLYRSYKIALPQTVSVEQTVAMLKESRYVEYAHPNYIMKAQMYPNDLYYSTPFPYHITRIDGLWGLKKLQCEQGWDRAQGDGVVVAVVDSGVDFNHEDLQSNIWLNQSEIPDNGTDDDGNGFPDDVRGWDFVNNDDDPWDDFGHGTHVAGTIAAVGNNGIGAIGVAPGAKIMALKGLGHDNKGNIADLAKCIRYAASNGARVINNSWGNDYRTPQIPTVEEAIDYAYSLNCVVIFSAGNENDDIAYYSPQNYSKVIAVASTDSHDRYSASSNYGNLIEVSAPGVDVLSTWPLNEYKVASGTSMACPHVSGIAALILSQNPHLRPQEVRQVIRTSAEDLGVPGKDIHFGYGRVNAMRALFGTGRIVVSIDEPIKQTFVRGDQIRIAGSALVENGFQRYEVYYVPKDNPQNLTRLASYTSPVENDSLLGKDANGQDIKWDTTQHPDGPCLIILKVINEHNIGITRSVELTIDNYNENPRFVNLTNKGAVIGRPFQFKVEAADPDDPLLPRGQLTYWCSDSAHFNPQNRTFSWQPSETDKGTREVTFKVTDGEGASEPKKILISTLYIEETKLITDPYRIFYPAIYGDKVVCEARGDINSFYIYRYDLLASIGSPISVGNNVKYKPHIYEDKIVWGNSVNGYNNIFMYDDSGNGVETQITLDPPSMPKLHYNPYIYGDKIVWSARDAGELLDQIYMFDLSKGLPSSENLPFAINPGSNSQTYPAICDNTVIWKEHLAKNAWGLITYDMLTGKKRIITSIYGGIVPLVIDGGKVAWLNNRIIYVYDPLQNRKKEIIAAEGRYGVLSIAMHADKVVWDRGQAFQTNSDIYMYDISGDREVQITDNSARQVNPAIYGDKIVWEDYRDGMSSLYMARLIYSPQIDSVNPASVAVGALVVITGKNFGSTQGDSTIRFANGATAQLIESWGDTEIRCRVPEDAQTGQVKVINTLGGESNGVEVTILHPAPPVCVAVSAVSVIITNINTSVSAVYADPDGYQDLENVELLVNSSVSSANCISLRYDRLNNKLYLRSDDGSSWLGGFAPRSNNTIENSFAKLFYSSSWVETILPDRIRVVFNIRVKPNTAFTGQKNIYLYAKDASGAESGWQQKATVIIENRPTVVSLSPNSGTFRLNTQLLPFNSQFSDLDGFNDIYTTSLLISTGMHFQNALYARYNKVQNKLYLWNRGRFVGGFTPESNNVIKTPYGNLYCAQTTVPPPESGTNLTVNWSLSFKTPLLGTRKVYLSVSDRQGRQTGWVQVGNITIGNIEQPKVPVITAVRPYWGRAGTRITITGRNFLERDETSSKVTFSFWNYRKTATIISWKDNEIVCYVPKMTYRWRWYKLWVSTKGGQSNYRWFYYY